MLAPGVCQLACNCVCSPFLSQQKQQHVHGGLDKCTCPGMEMRRSSACPRHFQHTPFAWLTRLPAQRCAHAQLLLSHLYHLDQTHECHACCCTPRTHQLLSCCMPGPQLVPENQRKEYIFKGVCIARFNKGIRTSFKIYNVFPEVGGFVQHFPL